MTKPSSVHVEVPFVTFVPFVAFGPGLNENPLRGRNEDLKSTSDASTAGDTQSCLMARPYPSKKEALLSETASLAKPAATAFRYVALPVFTPVLAITSQKRNGCQPADPSARNGMRL